MLRSIAARPLELRYRYSGAKPLRSIIGEQISANANARHTYATHDTYHSRHVSFGPGMFERSRDCPEKQPNLPHVNFTQGKRRERERGGEGERKGGGRGQKYEPMYAAHIRGEASANRRG